ncbi:hypothetical protein [Umezawaea beigongshangensis]|uniref:hypothetical protein n=1 Tax=Umezawaea beigongshangensis TaxID=2780383 RepID=UPI0018F157D9|nr:hypothetical protein [Umezawaea beigongshangensis]
MDDSELHRLGAAARSRLLRSGGTSAAHLLDVTLRAISREPEVFGDLDVPGAREAAAEADGLLAASDRRPLLGVPVAVEEGCATAVPALRAAGAVVLGRTRAADAARVVTSGCASAVLARNALGARTPAAVSGVVGFQPHLPRGGPRTGVIAARSADVALVLDGLGTGALAVPDRPLRIGVSLRGLALHSRTGPVMRHAVEDVAALLSLRGHEVRDSDGRLAAGARVLLAPHLTASPQELALLDRVVPASLRGLCRRVAAAERDVVGGMFDGLDVLVTPGHTGTSRRGPHPASAPFAPLWRVSGYPAVSVPAGRGGNGHALPVQLTASPAAEAVLLPLAALIEQDAVPPRARG